MKCHTTTVLTGNVGKFFKTSFLPPVQFCLAVVVVVGSVWTTVVSFLLLSLSVTLNDGEVNKQNDTKKEKN